MKSTRIMWLIYVLVGLIVMLPLMMSGYILTLDMVFVPHPPLPADVGPSYLFHAALHYLSYLIPGDVLQKMILFSIFVLSGIGMHKLVLDGAWRQTKMSSIAPYAAGILYVINPFVYGRFMAGQYAVLLGYMLLPFFARAFVKFLEIPGRRNARIVAGLVLAISILSIHTLGIAALFAFIALSIGLWVKRHDTLYLKAVLYQGFISAGIVLLLSSYWLIPVLNGHGVAELISGFTSVDQAAFATDGGLWQVLQLRGFWVEAQGLFNHVGDPLPLSGLAQLLLWVVIGIGVVKAWRLDRRHATLWSVSAVAAIMLATTPVTTLLAEYVPFFAGYREPHKFVALLALVFAVFAGMGVSVIWRKVQGSQWWKYGVAAVVLVLPLWVSPAMAWGFNGQLIPRQYPADWYEVNEQLKRDGPGKQVLFLPWHLYMSFGFTERIVAQPADKFFDNPIISSRDPEFAGLSPQYRDDVARQLNDDILPHAAKGWTFGAQISKHGIEYVLLAKDNDYHKYDYLDRQRDLVLVRETDHLKLYRVAEANHAKN